jgi:3-methyladenine DNA glycosylase/8-oxoguanine DNA glycosylase
MAKQTREISLETLDFLCSAHPAMNALIRHTGTLRYEISPPFEALVESVVGQQISGKAADAIRQRMADALGPPTPRALAGADGDTLRGCGLSGPKVRYIQGIAQAALSGAVDFEGLKRLPDEDVVKQLVTLPGVGRWTAEMLLLFSLDRPGRAELYGSWHPQGPDAAERP